MAVKLGGGDAALAAVEKRERAAARWAAARWDSAAEAPAAAKAPVHEGSAVAVGWVLARWAASWEAARWAAAMSETETLAEERQASAAARSETAIWERAVGVLEAARALACEGEEAVVD